MNKINMTVFVALMLFSAPHLALGDLHGDLTGNYSNTSLTFTVLSSYWLVALILLYYSPPLKIKLCLIIGGILGSVAVIKTGENILTLLLSAAFFGGFAWLCIEKRTEKTKRTEETPFNKEEE